MTFNRALTVLMLMIALPLAALFAAGVVYGVWCDVRRWAECRRERERWRAEMGAADTMGLGFWPDAETVAAAMDVVDWWLDVLCRQGLMTVGDASDLRQATETMRLEALMLLPARLPEHERGRR